MGYLKANILFTNGSGFCPYIRNHQCTIYDERPSICRAYPLSPNLDNKVYIDDSCPAVNNELGTDIVVDGIVTENFIYPTLENYQDKFINTHLHLEKFNDKKDFKKIITIKNMDFYRYIGTKKDFYLDLHISSLSHL